MVKYGCRMVKPVSIWVFSAYNGSKYLQSDILRAKPFLIIMTIFENGYLTKLSIFSTTLFYFIFHVLVYLEQADDARSFEPLYAEKRMS